MGNESGKSPSSNRITLSSAHFAAHLDSRARERAWREQSEEAFGVFDVTCSEDHPFEAHITLTGFGAVQLMEARDTFTRVARTAQNIAYDGSHDFFLNVNFGHGATTLIKQRGREMEIAPGTMGLTSRGDPGLLEWEPLGTTWAACVPRTMLDELLRSPDDVVMRAMDPHAPATRFLQDYLAFLFARHDVDDDPAVTDHVGRTLADLIALALGATSDAAEIAGLRGVRAARLQMILAGIQDGFDDPQFSAQVLAAKLGLSPRYVQNLLSETGRPLSDRVVELRLQKARKMLSEPSCAGMKVGDIAYACGFNEVPYFNRRFRSRFGASPTEYRPL
ncbi:AraC family transcriptional regulator [Methyloceanibacter caenitepidi]|uniref:Transcriptional regulator, AraC family n=1 Tax=Methyloceanibacter caenitepidi TaxID=1384459 RepID=A0A0A8K0I8_9HYPH|nr:AraC family transcriptional regulator [Methyloceanibacter caenitepidi]BAQ16488.1 transcriptional regulator, AraC family [Methyloceanibacter caenitepidi]